MNTIEAVTIRSPSGEEEECARLIIDDVSSPFVFHDIVQQERQYTLSLYIKSEETGSITIGGNVLETGTEWVQCMITFTSDSVDIPIYFEVAGIYYMYHTQLEIGCKATDFVESPDDTQAQITDISYRTSELEVDLDGISSRVSITETTLIGTEERLTTVETLAEQTAEQFRWLVASGDSQSEITLTDRMATLIAETISLNGDVKINGDMILDGAITADKIDVTDLFAQDIVATGSITGAELIGATGSFSGEVDADSFRLNGNYIKCESDVFWDIYLVESEGEYKFEMIEEIPIIQVPPPIDGSAGGVLVIDAVDAVKITGKLYGITKIITGDMYADAADIYSLKAKNASLEGLTVLKTISENGTKLEEKYTLKSSFDELSEKVSQIMQTLSLE